MPEPTKSYRIYCYDAARNVVSADWLEALDDQAAIAAAHVAGFGSQCEIWDGKRLVAELRQDRRTA
jgi:hypothetical protein